MKKGILTGLFALLLCVCLCPAFAAEREPEYYWYLENAGGGSYLETAGQTGGFFLSLDGGGSYAELPEVRAAAQRLGLVFDAAVYPLDNGGLRVEARDIWSTKAAFSKDYSAGELAKAMERAVPTPVRVLCTNGAVTVGAREAKNMYNGDWSQGNYYGWAEYGNEQQLVWSSDGVTWNRCEPYDLWAVTAGEWNGGEFRVAAGADQMVSADGIHWAKGEPIEWRLAKSPYACELGPYHFELVGTEVYLMGQSVDTGVLLPHMGDLFRGTGVAIGELQAWYGPNDTVMLAAYDLLGRAYVMPYPISSLDWCLENLSVKFREIEPLADNGTVALGLSAHRVYLLNQSDAQLLRRDTAGSGEWTWVENVPWSSGVQILPYNGETFLVKDTKTLELWAAEDGLSWREVEGLRPEMPTGGYNYVDYAFAWAGEGYLFCREAAEARHGMMGMSGGQWYEGNTKVYLLDEDFRSVREYDFGRLVEGVGYQNGVYYAQVANSDGTTYQGITHYHSDESGEYHIYDQGMFNPELGSTLYRSTDITHRENCGMTAELEQLIQIRK